MTTDYSALTRYNEEQLGKDRKSRMSQVAMYADTAHFVYELLQNADDVGATEIHFLVSETQLLIEHDGAPFDEQNVRAISYFGMGKTDITKIGHFGLGFKSVFAYTASPRIHSGHESFAITNLYSVAAVPHPADLASDRTRIILPFDHETLKPDYIERGKLKSSRDAYNDIARKLAEIGPTTLLFMKTLREIRWETDDYNGHYVRKDKPNDKATETIITTEDNAESSYLVFTRAIRWPDEHGIDQERAPVQIAFLLNKQEDDERTISPIKNPPLYVFFPTEKETHVGFIIQGPYRTTPARDNVPADDAFNSHLADQTGELIVDTLWQLKRRRLLTLDVLSLFPLNSRNFANTLFQPIHAAVREALAKQPLLPTATRGYVSADHAKLAREAWITKAFSPVQLDSLFNAKDMRWLDPHLTQSKHPDLYRLLVGEKQAQYPYSWVVYPLVPDIEVLPATIAAKLGDAFLAQQTDQWLSQFYAIIYDEKTWNTFANCPYLRLSDDTLVVPSNSPESPRVFLPFEGDDACRGLQVIKPTLLTEDKAREFLESILCLKKPDCVDLLCKEILPLYCESKQPKIAVWRKHFALIVDAMREASSSKRKKLVETLANASFILSVWPGQDGKRYWTRIDNTYESTNNLEAFFTGCDAIFLLAPNTYSEKDIDALRDLGVGDTPRVTKKHANNQGHVAIRDWHGDHSRGRDGFDPNWKMDGVEFAVTTPTLIRSRLLWTYLMPHWQCIRGVIESSNRQNYEDPKRRSEISATGKMLLDAAWLPDKRGQWHKPSELSRDELPDDFEKYSQTAETLANQLGMRKPEEQRAVISLAKGNELKQRVFEFVLHADDAMLAKFEKLVSNETKPIEHISFKEGIRSFERRQSRTAGTSDVSPSAVKHPERYQEKLNESTREAMTEGGREPIETRFSLVRETSSTRAAREFLYCQYSGKCQIGGATFPKRNGANYFEAIFIVPRVSAEYLNDPGNMLCLSAEMSAKVMHASFEWIDDIESKIKDFKAEVDEGSVADRQVRCRIAGQEEVITWTEQHFMRLKSLWDCAD